MIEQRRSDHGARLCRKRRWHAIGEQLQREQATFRVSAFDKTGFAVGPPPHCLAPYNDWTHLRFVDESNHAESGRVSVVSARGGHCLPYKFRCLAGSFGAKCRAYPRPRPLVFNPLRKRKRCYPESAPTIRKEYHATPGRGELRRPGFLSVVVAIRQSCGGWIGTVGHAPSLHGDTLGDTRDSRNAL